MGERKVLNKYIPADFDPQLVPRSKKPKDDLVPVRMMLPFSIQCSTCSSFLYRGRKFNSKKEAVKGIEGKYLGIQRYRFYIKCTDCARPITFLTDPKNADYEMESGGTRNYEVWHDESQTNAENEKSVEEEEKLDSMKALENRVAESQREMAELDALEEIRAMNERHRRLMKGGRDGNVAEVVLKAREEKMLMSGDGGGGGTVEEVELDENGLTREEEDLVQSIKFGGGGADVDASTVEIRRLDEQDELLAEKRRQEEAEAIMNKQKQHEEKKGPIFKVKRKKKKPISAEDTAAATSKSSSVLPEAKRIKVQEEKVAEISTQPQESAGLSGLLGCYGSDSDSD